MTPYIRLVCVPADAEPRVLTRVPNTAAGLHAIIGGYLEVFRMPLLTVDPMNGLVALCDEEGWLKPQPLTNPYSAVLHGRPVAGTILIVRARPDGEFGSVTLDDLASISYVLGVELTQGGSSAQATHDNPTTRRA